MTYSKRKEKGYVKFNLVLTTDDKWRLKKKAVKERLSMTAWLLQRIRS